MESTWPNDDDEITDCVLVAYAEEAEKEYNERRRIAETASMISELNALAAARPITSLTLPTPPSHPAVVPASSGGDAELVRSASTATIIEPVASKNGGPCRGVSSRGSRPMSAPATRPAGVASSVVAGIDNAMKRRYWGGGDSMIHTKRACIGECRNCRVPDVPLNYNVCDRCRELKQCQLCKRRLRDDLYPDARNRICAACARKERAVASWRQQHGGSFRSSVRGAFVERDLEVDPFIVDVEALFSSLAPAMRQILEEQLLVYGNIKWNLSAEVSFRRETPEGIATTDARFVNPAQPMLNIYQFDHQLGTATDIILSRVQAFTEVGSNWTVSGIRRLIINTCAYDSIGGSGYIPLPKFIEDKHATVNVMNERDDYCFLWAVLSYLYPANKHHNRLSKYEEYFDTLNIRGLTFPLKIKDIPKFEKRNVTLAINVQYLDVDDRPVPIYASSFRGRQHVINLMLLTETDEHGEEFNSHYVLVRNLSRLLSSSTLHEHAVHVCTCCNHRFIKEANLRKHVLDCGQHKPCAIRFPAKYAAIDDLLEPEEQVPADYVHPHQPPMKTMRVINPDEDEDLMAVMNELDNNGSAFVKAPPNIKCFRYIQSAFKCPSIVYCDFECFITKFDIDETQDVHIPSGWSALRVNDPEIFDDQREECKATLYSGDDPKDVMIKFYEHVLSEVEIVNKVLSKNLDMQPLSLEQDVEFVAATKCVCCGKSFGEKNRKTRHHSHVTGLYIGPCCNRCNANLKFIKSRESVRRKDDDDDEDDDVVLPIVIHNSMRYDAHLIFKYMTSIFSGSQTKILATNSEKFIAFQIGQLVFIDSYNFLNASLETLSNELAQGGFEKFHHTRRHFPDPAQLGLVCRKGVYPYEWADSYDKLLVTELPPKEMFFSKLYDEGISDTDYEHAHKVWRAFDLKSMQQYHDLYLTTDVLLLADVFENFRSLCISEYGLDSAHFYTLPSFSWHAMLKFTDIHLNLLTDIDTLNMFEKGIRGGVASIMNRYSKANNQYVDGFDLESDKTFLMYLDANALYSYAMTCALPTGGFRFLTEAEIATFDLESKGGDDPIGYALEVDLDYPACLHDRDNDYPLAVESLRVTEDMLSPTTRKLMQRLGKKTGKEKKLIPNLLPKTKYVVHYRNLQYYVSRGMNISKIHRIIRFEQRPWLKPYIEKNMDKRAAATSSFDKSFFKLLNNSVYGKTMENLRNRCDVRLVMDEVVARKLTARPNFESARIINDDVTFVKMRKTSIFWDSPVYLGFAILELSKLHMYKFHYDVIKRRYDTKAKLLFTDTDSLCYEIKTEDLYADMREDSEYYDFSDYPETHPNYDATNKKRVGYFKDECCGVPATEFVGLRAKMYSISMPDDEQKATAKGVQRAFAKKHLCHQAYRDCLLNSTKSSAKFYSIRSVHHQLKTVCINKEALSPYDDKRYILPNSHDTLAYGHYRISSTMQ